MTADVLYIPQRGNVEPWLSDFQDVAGGRLDLAVFDHDGPLGQQLEGVTAVVDHGGHATVEIIDAGARAGVKLWQVLGTGLDHSEVAHILRRGILLANTPGQFSALALAEHALMLMLCLAKRLREAGSNARQGIMYAPVSEELHGQVLGLVGLGASGRELSRRANALGLQVQAVDVAPISPDQLRDVGVQSFTGLDGLDRMLATSDYVSLHVPLTAETHHMIDGRRLSLMQPTAMLINVARGRIVDEGALVSALECGDIAGAGIDVFGEEPLQPTNPLLRMPNAIVTPHMAGATRGTSRRRCNACVENALRVLHGEQPLYRVEGEA